MIRLTVKGRQPEVEAELSRRNIPPFAILETKSQFVPEFYTCDVAVTDAHRAAVSRWFDDGDTERNKGQGFPVGSLLYFSAPNPEEPFFHNPDPRKEGKAP
jgi:hypothetical protein